jgi:hypothetical protein
MLSTAAAMLASTAGWRYVTLVTNVASFTRGTVAARAAMIDQHSRVSPSSGVASGPFGMKWSAKYTPSHPVRSQCSASSRISSHDRVGAGQMLNRIRRPYGEGGGVVSASSSIARSSGREAHAASASSGARTSDATS